MRRVHKIRTVMLAQPNFAWFGKKTWKLLPYNLGLLNASLKKASYDAWIFDPNFLDSSEEEVRKELGKPGRMLSAYRLSPPSTLWSPGE